uniref:Uncharacterized protein n=1 Tax=Terrapene triunguis TaxID=2587831 RepID=A0A674JUU5_9SAUR
MSPSPAGPWTIAAAAGCGTGGPWFYFGSCGCVLGGCCWVSMHGGPGPGPGLVVGLSRQGSPHEGLPWACSVSSSLRPPSGVRSPGSDAVLCRQGADGRLEGLVHLHEGWRPVAAQGLPQAEILFHRRFRAGGQGQQRRQPGSQEQLGSYHSRATGSL